METGSMGNAHTLAIKIDGTLWAWGANGAGQLGLGDTDSRITPVQVGPDKWKQVACGSGHTIAVKEDGSLWGWGNNSKGQLGLGDTQFRYEPVRLDTTFLSWTHVACGDSYSYAMREDGKLWRTGDNSACQLGNLQSTEVLKPYPQVYNWKQVACGSQHTLAIREDGTLWGWGYGTQGQLALEERSHGSYQKFEVMVTSGRWKQVSCGGNHTLALAEDGRLFVFGYNRYGPLGLGEEHEEHIVKKPVWLQELGEVDCLMNVPDLVDPVTEKFLVRTTEERPNPLGYGSWCLETTPLSLPPEFLRQEDYMMPPV